jgi:hypothetical protein
MNICNNKTIKNKYKYNKMNYNKNYNKKYNNNM